MRVLQTVEDSITRWMDRLFIGPFKRPLQFPELVRMLEGYSDRVISELHQAGVPLYFGVILHPADYKNIVSTSTPAIRQHELNEYLQQYIAASDRYQLLDRPRIELKWSSDATKRDPHIYVLSSTPGASPLVGEGQEVSTLGLDIPQPEYQLQGVLRCLQGHKLRGHVYPLNRSIITIGRGMDNDLLLDDRYVSRQHAKIVHRNKHYHIEDLTPTILGNGVFVRTPARGQEIRITTAHILSSGDQIRIGSYYFDFDEDNSA